MASPPRDTANKAAARAPFAPTWPVDSTDRICRDPLENASDCWRTSPLWVNQEIGFPGARSNVLSLASLEPVLPNAFFQPGVAASPYRLGGHLPFDRVREGQGLEEVWSPVLPVDTPITSLHWARGALRMNQFTLNLRRMLGDRAYLGLQYHSDHTDSMFYDYAFNVHQPYLSGWGILGKIYGPIKRDSASLVISDTSQQIQATQVRPRLGFWIDSQTVVEVFGDWLNNSSSLTQPTDSAHHDSTQILFPSAFSATTLGGVAARNFHNRTLTGTFEHTTWDRHLQPRNDSLRYQESSSGTEDRLRTEGVSPWGRARVTLENHLEENALWLTGKRASGPDAEAWGDREAFEIEAGPGWKGWSSQASATGERRSRADGKTEWLGGGQGSLAAKLPGNFHVTGGAGWRREGAPEDDLFRWQPVLGFYPNPDLRPRRVWSFQAGTGWTGRRVEVGMSWDQARFDGNWLPPVLPRGALDTAVVNDSLALARVNYASEVRDLLHLSLALRLGRWNCSLYHTLLLSDAIRDAALGVSQQNSQTPERIYQGQLGWHRKLFEDKLDVRTEWDWEWFSTRYAFASNLDGTSRVEKLDEYLVLDFTARMVVKTFGLYFRAMNFNHDRYATEPGVHPPGLNFRFGIDWRLAN